MSSRISAANALPVGDGWVDPKGVTVTAKPGGGGGLDPGLIADIVNIIKDIIDAIGKDDDNRGQFTKTLVSKMFASYPEYNWVCCHTAHSYRWDGQEGVDWAHDHEEFDIVIGGTIGYEIYWAGSGIFALHGDGGFENWAYIGSVSAKSEDGRLIMFSTP
ncbi:hypothetical protein NLJ89_g5906 [Agrocybe chaxingu]|uniref:DUF7888 domain-containing protein n=1 Tax=Agrocybe chaxingu TaxID=84603 RepID=A0A9W8JZC7_9AGAR|nr:hypothetical protein NLJ89_g5906 [Agrocybe chaxingu]